MDSDLTAASPTPLPVPGGTTPALSVSGTAGRGTFLIEGEVASARGETGGGIDRIRIGGRVVVRDVTIPGSLGLDFVATPGTLRRERTTPRGTVVETVIAAPTLPLLVVQWSASPLGDDGALVLTLSPGGAQLRHIHRDGALRVFGHDPEECVAIMLLGSTGDWSLADAGTGRVRASHGMEGDGPSMLVVTAGPEAVVRSALAATAYLAVHEQRATASTAEGIRVVSGVSALDDGVAWASSRVRASLLRGSVTRTGARSATHDLAATGHRVFWSGLGALATGDVKSARGAVALLEAAFPCGEQPGPEGTLNAMATLLAARLALVSGDASAARRHARLILDADRPPTALSADAWSLRRLALDTLADALLHAESGERIVALRTLAGEPPMTPAADNRLPVVADPSSAGAFLRSLLSGDLGHAPSLGIPELDDALETWSDFARDPDAAWERWRKTLTDGLRTGPMGPATWDESPDLLEPGAPVTGAVLAAFCHGVLGYTPDAPSGRIRLAPRLPSDLRSLTVERLRVGSASITLRYERSNERHRFVVEPTSARVPPMLVLEPSLPGTRLVEARVGPERVDLQQGAERDRVRIRIQLPLDAPRTVDLRTR